MKEDKRSEFVVVRPPLEFLRYILELAERANDLHADRVSFDIGRFEGASLNVEIIFSYKGFEEAEEDGSNI